MEDVNTENIEMCTYGDSRVTIENGNDEEMGVSDKLLRAQNAGNDTEQEHRAEDRLGRCNIGLGRLTISLCLMTLDQVLDVINVYSFYAAKQNVFFVLSAFSTFFPTMVLHQLAVYKLKFSTCKAWLCFPLGHSVLLVKVIYIHLKGNIDEEGMELKRVLGDLTVLEGYFESIIQLLIQTTALRMGILTENRVIFSYVKIVVGCLSASYAVLANFREKTHFVAQGVAIFLMAMILGSRVFLCASLFALPSPFHYTGFIPLVLSFLLALAADYKLNGEEISFSSAYCVSTCCPPGDMVGVVASLVYCVSGLVFWLLTLSRPWSALVFAGLTISHFLGGIGWRRFINTLEIM